MKKCSDSFAAVEGERNGLLDLIGELQVSLLKENQTFENLRKAHMQSVQKLQSAKKFIASVLVTFHHEHVDLLTNSVQLYRLGVQIYNIYTPVFTFIIGYTSSLIKYLQLSI